MRNNANKSVVIVEKEDNTSLLRCNGAWTLKNITEITSVLQSIFQTTDKKSNINFDISAVDEFDSAGIILLLHTVKIFKVNSNNVNISGVSNSQEKMLAMFRGEEESADTSITKRYFFLNILKTVGKNTVSVLRDIVQFIAFLGESIASLGHYILHPSSIRFKAIIKNIEEAGVRALPIVAVTSFLIGVVIAYQSAVQLEKFGANLFIVDMIAISVTRELAPLITAIVVAGRSGSSYTAQIGVMKITEEIDAMKTMSFDPFRFLVLPRIIALMIAMPLMIFFADIFGICGGMFIAEIKLNLSYAEFINRLQNVLETKHLWVGIIKAPFFAFLIATVGCFRGFQVSYSTESIGRYTTISVVNAIFLVIACDAVFSVFLTELGI
ncbi:MAG: ABC transporter permease [Thiotrichaceae bacterium]|nr:MAG: ABC transporter permease [Thiotrichaceae bacterium]